MADAARTLDVLQGVIFAAARKAEASPDHAHRIAELAIAAIIAEFGSTKVYISDGSELRRRARNDVIAANARAGMPLERIARRTGLSYRRVAAIVQALGLRASPGDP